MPLITLPLAMLPLLIAAAASFAAAA